MPLTIDVISDMICPWCFIGKRRLEMAVAAFDEPVKVRWLPFQLNPTMPKEGVSRLRQVAQRRIQRKETVHQ